MEGNGCGLTVALVDPNGNRIDPATERRKVEEVVEATVNAHGDVVRVVIELEEWEEES
jgi:hypothetical protein